jgi:hypothetical protein
MSNPEIATILDNGTYGQRPMTDEEYAHYLALQADMDEPRTPVERVTDETPAAD